MRTIFILIIIIFSLVIAQGQIETYPLDEYKRPILKRSTFILDGFLNSDNQFISDNQTNDQSTLRLNAISNYIRFANNRSTQTRLSHFTSINTFIDYENEEKYSTTLQHTSRYNSRRFNTNNFFIRLNPEVQVVYDFGNAIEDHSKTIGSSFLIGGGKGRVESVNDAWLATSILQALKNGGKLEREPTHQEITHFAEEIARIKNARVLDFRNKIIFELDEIFKYIMNLGLVKENTLAFAIVYDAWRYEIYGGRSTGSILETYISPSYAFRHGENEYNSSGQDWTVQYSKYNPINLKWESTQIVSVGFNSYFNDFPSSNSYLEQIKDNISARIAGSYHIEYFLSRRTNFGFYNFASYSKNLRTKYTTTSFLNSFDWVHWPSPQLRLTTNFGVSTNLQKSEFFKRNIVSPDFNISVQYSIF